VGYLERKDKAFHVGKERGVACHAVKAVHTAGVCRHLVQSPVCIATNSFFFSWG